VGSSRGRTGGGRLRRVCRVRQAVAVAPFLAMTLVAARGAATSYYVDPGNPTPCATLREAIQAAGLNA